MSGYSPFSNNTNNTNQMVQDNRPFFSKLLRQISTFGGAGYDSMIVKNAVAFNVNEDPKNAQSSLYNSFSSKATAMMVSEQPIAYLKYGYDQKRKVLREFSTKDEIRDFVTSITDKAIVYNKDKKFCHIDDLPDNYNETIKNYVVEIFNKIYFLFKFNQGLTAWKLFKKFIVDGFIAFEIVYDDKLRNIVGFNELDVTQLVYAIDPETGHKLWVTYPGDTQFQRVLLDSQVLYLSYSAGDDLSEISYIEPLIRPYNMLQLLLYTKLNFNLMNAMMYKKFTIPTKGMPRILAEQEVGQMIADYRDEVTWDDSLGIMTIDGQQRVPYSKEFWFPENDNGTPQMEIVSPEGANLNEDVTYNIFYNILKRASKLPFNKFDLEGGGGNLYGMDSDTTNEDLDYELFISRIQTSFRDIIIKPIYIQTVLKFPELKDNYNFYNDLSIIFNANTEIEEGRKLVNMKTKAEIASTIMNSLQDKEGNSFIHIEKIMRDIMGWTDEDFNENKKYFSQSPNAVPGSAGGPSGGGGPGGEGDFNLDTGGEDNATLDEAPVLEEPPTEAGGGEPLPDEADTEE